MNSILSYMKKIWHNHYAPGVPSEIHLAENRTIHEIVNATGKNFGSQKAFTLCLSNGMNGSLSFKEVTVKSQTLSVYLREVLKLKAGDRVAVQMPNCLSYPIVALGVLQAGCVLVNTNPLYTDREMALQFADAEISALFISDMFVDKFAKIQSQFPNLPVITSRIDEFLPFFIRPIVRATQKYWDQVIPSVNVGQTTLRKALQAVSASEEEIQAKLIAYQKEFSQSSPAALQYTGGTTGRSKGAVLSHRNLLANMTQLEGYIGHEINQGKEVVLTALPLYHVFALTTNFLLFYSFGAHNILIPNPRPISNLKRAFENYKITWLSGVNTLFHALNNEHWFIEYPPKTIKAAVSGGMALQSSVAKAWTQLTGSPIIEGYGLTETSPVLIAAPLGGKIKPDVIGLPIPSTDIELRGEDGTPVPQGTPGEIFARGPQVMDGYWRQPAETTAVLKDGWFATGDIGIMDDEGYIKIVDRKKDMILVSGFNVYPNEVEDVLAKHPAISEVAVVGVEDSETGEAVKAYFVLRPGHHAEVEALRKHCRESLTPYKVPKYFEPMGELPKSNVGKILRRELKALKQMKTNQ